MDARPSPSVRPEDLLQQLGWVSALAASLLRDPGMADDVLQQVCLLALQRGPDSSRGVRGLRAWLASVTRRLVLHSGRAEARRLRRERAAARPEALPSTIDSVQRREALRSLVDALSGLEEPYNTTIVQRYFEGRSVAEIAEGASISPAAVRQRLARARQRLRARIQQTIERDRSGWLALALAGPAIGKAAGAAAGAGTRLTAGSSHLPARGGLVMAKSTTSTLVTKLAVAVVLAIAAGVLIWPAGGGSEQRTSSAPRTAADASSHGVALSGADLLPTPAEARPEPLAPAELAEGVSAVSADEATKAPRHDGPPGSYRIVVVDDAARVVPWAFVEILRRGPPVHPESLASPPTYSTISSTRADPGGRCAIVLPDPDDVLLASHDSLGSSGMRTARQLDASCNDDGEAVVALQPYLAVEGMVVDAIDRPIAGAPVSIRSTGADALTGDPRPPPPLVTGADGRFRGVVDRSRQYAIETAWQGRTAGRVVNPKSDDAVWVTLQFPGDWTIAGRLTDERGAPLATASVVAWRADDEGDQDLTRPWRTGPRTLFQADTDADGRYALSITAAGTYGITAISKGPRTIPEPVWVHLEGAEAHATADLSLPPAAAIAGHVVDNDGAPVDRATVEVRAAPPVLLQGSTFLLPVVSRKLGSTTHRDGSFTLQPLPASGVYEIRAYRSRAFPPRLVGDDELPWEAVAVGRSDVTLVAAAIEPPRGSIRITPVLATPGVRLEDVVCSVVAEGETSGVAGRRGKVADGIILVTDLDASVLYTVVLAAKGLGGVDVHDVQPTPEGTPLIVHLPAPGALDVTVEDARGAVVPYAQVEISRSFNISLDPFMSGIGLRPTDAHGTVRFEALDPGHYTVVTWALGARVESVVEVPDGGRVALRVELPREP